MLNNVLKKRPESPEFGDVWEQPIEEILTTWSSCDMSHYTSWEDALNKKRRDAHYGDVVESIKENGFLRPLTMYYNDGDEAGQPFFGDGHHRLAAAIDLGYATIPVRYRHGAAISGDSGYWRKHHGVPEESAKSVAGLDAFYENDDDDYDPWGDDFYNDEEWDAEDLDL